MLKVKNIICVALLSLLTMANAVSQNIFEKVNSYADEQSPVFHPSGKQLFFTRANDTLNVGGVRDKGDIWVSQLGADGAWQKPVNLGRPVNNEMANGVIGFSPDGKIMFLFNHYTIDGSKPSTQGLSYSVWEGGKWSAPKKLNIEYFLNRSSHVSGSISADGSTMIISMQSYANEGEEDLYVSFYNDGVWSTPQTLGSGINTSAQEMSPYLTPDTKTLFFSSNGYGGYGGRDLFVSSRLDSTWKNWSKPVNLGADVNTEGVEIYFAMGHDNKGIYTSNTNSDGYGDFKVYIPPVDSLMNGPVDSQQFVELLAVSDTVRSTRILSGHVIDGKTNLPLNARIIFNYAGITDTASTQGLENVYRLEVSADVKSIKASVTSPGYLGTEEVIFFENGLYEKVMDFSLTQLEVGKTIQLNKVYFEKGTAVLIDSSYSELDRLINVMEEYPEMEIELAGHTDNQGDSKLNLNLSRDRVEAVKAYLVEKGISAKRIKGKGYGGTKPVASNASELTRKLNRRVEFVIVKM